MGLLDLFKNRGNRAIDAIEWADASAEAIVQPYQTEQRPIKMGARLTVRETQAVIFADEGKAADCFGPGRYRLSTRYLPLLAARKGWKSGHKAPFHAEVYCVNTRQFPGVKWSTSAPLTIKIEGAGPIRLQASGTFAFKVSDAAALMNEILEANGIYENAFLIGQLKSILLSGLSESIAQSGLEPSELEASSEELAEQTENRLRARLASKGFELSQLMIESMTVLADEKPASVCLCGHPLAEGEAYCSHCGRKM